VIGPDLVVTVRHVLPDADAQPCVSTLASRGFVDAAVVGVVNATPEAILLLRVELNPSPLGQLLGFSGFAGEECYRLGDGSPAVIVTSRGSLDFVRGQLLPGDSGSPVLDQDGDLVGLLCGRLRGVPAVALLDRHALDLALRRELDLSSLRRPSGLTLASARRHRSPFGVLEHALSRGLR
jgi:hypothetical protein